MYQEAEQIEEFATLKEDIEHFITNCQKDLKEKILKAIKLEINDTTHIHAWNDEDVVFYNKSDKWYMGIVSLEKPSIETR